MLTEWKTGQVKFFNQEKGFGFIECLDDKQDYFIHISKIVTEPINEDDFVVFKLSPSKKKPGTNEAVRLSLLSKFDSEPNFLIEQFSKYDKDSIRKEILKALPVENALKIVEQELAVFKVIENDGQYSEFKKKTNQLTALFGQPILKAGVQQIISAWADQITTEIYRVQLWLDGIISGIPDFNEIEACFLNSNEKNRVEIFIRLENEDKQLLLQNLIKEEQPEKVIDFILEYLRKKNNLGYYADLKSKLTDSEYWIEKIDYEVLVETSKYFEKTLDEHKLFELFFLGYLPTFSSDYVLQNFSRLSKEQIETVLQSGKLSIPEVHKILIGLIRENHLSNENSKKEYVSWLYEAAAQVLKHEWFAKFDKEGAEILSEDVHYSIWEKGYSKILPTTYIVNLLLNSETIQPNIDGWLSKNRLSKEEIIKLLKQNVQQLEKVINRKQFYVLLNHLEALFSLEIPISELLSFVKVENIWFGKLASWVSGLSEEFDFDEFKSKLVYLSPSHQLKFLKKIFWLKHTGKFDLNIDKLNQLTRIDFDIYKLNQTFHPDIPLDISVDVAIEAIKSFQAQGKFLFDNDLLKIVVKDISLNSKHKFQISGLFEKCKGRYEAKFNWERNGEISKLTNGWQISFEYDRSLVEEVKKLPNRRYDMQTKNWFIPLSEEEAVYKFAKQFRFFIHRNDGNNYSNNVHLAEWRRTSVPNGIQFCEGRLANKNHQTFNSPFWWCCNEACFKNCEADHTDKNYKPESENREDRYTSDDLPF